MWSSCDEWVMAVDVTRQSIVIVDAIMSTL